MKKKKKREVWGLGLPEGTSMHTSSHLPNLRVQGSRFESLIVSHHSRFTCECNKEDINDVIMMVQG